MLSGSTWVNCNPDWDSDTARSPQTGEPLARISSDLGVIRKLSNLQPDKIKHINSHAMLRFNFKERKNKHRENIFIIHVEEQVYKWPLNYFCRSKERTLMLFGIILLTNRVSAQNIVALSHIQWEEVLAAQLGNSWSQTSSFDEH